MKGTFTVDPLQNGEPLMVMVVMVDFLAANAKYLFVPIALELETP